MMKSANHIYALQKPSSENFNRPIVFDSPHSGTEYPFDNHIVAPKNALRSTWDAFVDELWECAPTYGAALLAARFPRAYIDPNRAPDDIDASLLSEPWPTPLVPSATCMRGMGLIRTNALPGVPMYRGKIPVSEVQRRITQYYDPYHDKLKELLDAAHAAFGKVWHVNCHSMKSTGNAMNVDNGFERPDIVVSDLNGIAASSEFTEWVATQFDQLGYRTRINTPYQGGFIVQRYGMPLQGRHSIQIEIKRGLYMDEKRFEKSPGFDKLQRDLQIFTSNLSIYVDHKLRKE